MDLAVTLCNDGLEDARAFRLGVFKDRSDRPRRGEGEMADEDDTEVTVLASQTRNQVLTVPGISYDSPGQKRLWVLADCSDAVRPELDEDNNCLPEPVVITVGASTAAPDLAIQSVSASKINPNKDERFTVDVAVKNQGAVDAGAFRVDLFKDRASAPANPSNGDMVAYVAGLGAGASTSVRFTGVSYPDANTPHLLWVLADAAGQVAESSESNNTGPAGGLAINGNQPGSGGNEPPYITELRVDRKYANSGQVHIIFSTDDPQGAPTVRRVRVGYNDPIQGLADVWVYDNDNPAGNNGAGTATVEITPLVDAEYTSLILQAWDTSGNQSPVYSREDGFVVDRVAPTMTDLHVDRVYVKDGAVRILFSTDDNTGSQNIASVRVGYADPFNGLAYVWVKTVEGYGAGEGSVDIGPLVGEKYGLIYEAFDSAGNRKFEQPGDKFFYVDKTAPYVTALTTNPQLANGGTVHTHLSSDDNSGSQNVVWARLYYLDPFQPTAEWPNGRPTLLKEVRDYGALDTDLDVSSNSGLLDGDYSTLLVELWDRAGNNQLYERPGAGFVLDRAAPELTSAAFEPGSVFQGQDSKLTYEFSDSRWDYAMLTLQSETHSTSAVRVDDATGAATFHTNGLPAGQYQLRYEGFDSLGNHQGYTVPTQYILDVGLAVWQRAGLHFMGTSSSPYDPSPATVLGATGWRLARFDAAEARFVEHAPGQRQDAAFDFQAGRGLWLWLDRDTTLKVAGTPTARYVGFGLPLSKGWNSVANPYNADLPWLPSDIRVLLDGADIGSLADQTTWQYVSPYAWTFDSSRRRYVLVTDQSIIGASRTIPWLAGFWLYAHRDGVTIQLSPPATSLSRARQAQPRPGEWSTQLRVQAGEQEAGVRVGVSAALQRALDIANPPSPIPPDGLRLELLDPASGQRSVGRIEAGAGSTVTWDLVATAAAPGEVTLTWPSLLRDLPRGVLFELTDLQTGGVTLLNTRSSYAFTPTRAGEERRFRLVARSGRLQRAEITALVVQPSRSAGTTVSLSLSAPAEVDLTVRGLGGRLVRTSHQSAAAGTTTLTWDGRDAAGRRVPAGVYQVEVAAVAANGAASRAVRTVVVR